MTIELLTERDISDDLQEQLTELYTHLNAEIKQLSLKRIFENNEAIIFAVCRDQDTVLGIALMATYKVISGYKGMVEDVVVHSGQRGKGIGRKLMEKLLEEGKNRNLDEILLFSGHHRQPAINLYKSLGFQLKNSGLYRLIIKIN